MFHTFHGFPGSNSGTKSVIDGWGVDHCGSLSLVTSPVPSGQLVSPLRRVDHGLLKTLG